MNTQAQTIRPAQADRPSRQPRPAGRAIVNIQLTGCNINAGRDLYYSAPAQWQADTIRAQAATIAAQQKTIDRLLAIIEGLNAGA